MKGGDYMPIIHEHSLSVRLGQESGNPEIYCLDPQCYFRANYDPESVTHRETFERDVTKLSSKEN